MDVGVEINQYVIVERIGRGGMAHVWSARDSRLNRTVAIKTIAPDLNADVDPIELFEREAQVIAQLEHPHILPIYDFGEFDNQLYIVMRYVTGGSLENLVADGPLSVSQSLRIGTAVGAALDYAHQNNVIHLDIKPSNILLDSNASPYLADFGLATVTDPEGRAANPGYGTLLYMAPEQLTAQELDFRADIYSFTILMYHLLTGELPFDATTSLALKQLQFQEEMPDLEETTSGLPSGITPVLRRGTALKPDMRPSSVSELIEELRAVLAPQTVGEASVEQGVLILDGGAAADRPASSDATESLADIKPISPEDLARQEAVDIYSRARRAWAHGQGRFLLGVTHFMLISDYYVRAEEYELELDNAGTQMLLRGALEYDHQVDHWWAQLEDDDRRWVALHAARSENAPARVRALYRLETLPDSDPPRIPNIVAQVLQVEQNDAAKIAALHVFSTRASLMNFDSRRSYGNIEGSMLTTRLRSFIQSSAPRFWREYVYSPDIDELIAETALDWECPDIAERAARVIGRIRSLRGVNYVAEQQRQGRKGALRTLALIRDEVPYLPHEVAPQARAYAWLTNTWRRLSEQPMGIVWRFVFAFLGGTGALSVYAFVNLMTYQVLINEVTGRSISVGITIGVFYALVVLLGGELPARLTKFWPWWGRLLAGVLLGTLAGGILWTVYNWLLLYATRETLDGWVMLFGGFGMALGFAISGTFRLRGWQGALLTIVIIFLAFRLDYDLVQATRPSSFFYDLLPADFRLPSSFFFFGTEEVVNPQSLMIAILLALGGFFQALWADIYALAKRAGLTGWLLARFVPATVEAEEEERRE